MSGKMMSPNILLRRFAGMHEPRPFGGVSCFQSPTLSANQRLVAIPPSQNGKVKSGIISDPASSKFPAVGR